MTVRGQLGHINIYFEILLTVLLDRFILEIYALLELYHRQCHFQKCSGGLNLNTPSFHHCWQINSG